MNKNSATEFTEDIKKTYENFNENEDIVAMKKTAHEVADAATEFIREYPVASVMGAVALGFILGRLTAKKGK